MTKRDITPYKGDESGGRTERVHIRATKRTRWRAFQLVEWAGFDSLADWFDAVVNEQYGEAQTDGGEDVTRTS